MFEGLHYLKTHEHYHILWLNTSSNIQKMCHCSVCSVASWLYFKRHWPFLSNFIQRKLHQRKFWLIASPFRTSRQLFLPIYFFYNQLDEDVRDDILSDRKLDWKRYLHYTNQLFIFYKLQHIACSFWFQFWIEFNF